MDFWFWAELSLSLHVLMAKLTSGTAQHEAVIGGDFVVTIQCCANKTANNFHGNAIPCWWGEGDEREWNGQAICWILLPVSTIDCQTFCWQRHVNKHSNPNNRCDASHVDVSIMILTLRWCFLNNIVSIVCVLSQENKRSIEAVYRADTLTVSTKKDGSNTDTPLMPRASLSSWCVLAGIN